MGIAGDGQTARSQPPRGRRQDARRKVGKPREHGAEVAPADDVQATSEVATTVAVRCGSPHERDLAEEVAGAEDADDLPILNHLDGSVDDDEEVVGERSLFDQHVARRHGDAVGEHPSSVHRVRGRRRSGEGF